MTLQEAIYRTNLVESVEAIKCAPKIIEALDLLIEAGKRVMWHKGQHLDGYYELLPGETEE